MTNDSYTPQMKASYWAEIRDFVTAAVDETAERSTYTTRQLYAAATPLTLWAWQTAAMPLERDVIFSLHTIERFTAVGMPHYRSRSGRNTIRSRLLRISEVLVGIPVTPPILRPLGRSEPSMPYSAREVITLRSWALAQTTVQRRTNASALLALGLGAGLAGREIISLTTDDINVDDDGVTIHIRGSRAREVPVLREWEQALTERVATATGEWAFRSGHVTATPNLITNFVSRTKGEVQLQVRRMHATWIVHHLEAGTPLTTLMDAAGLQSPEALDRFLRFVRNPGEPTRRSALRDARARPR